MWFLFYPLLLTITIASAATYSDPFARSKMMPLSAAAYSSKPEACLQNVFANATLKRRLEVLCDSTRIDTCSGYTAVSHPDQAILLVYRGTNRNFELLIETEETLRENHTVWLAGGTVSKFYADGFNTLWKQGMKDDLLSLINKYPGYQLWITGHSLGGAMAVLAASYITHTGILPTTKVTLVTFGEPRAGDAAFADSVDREVINAFRVTHAKDPVPHLPRKGEQGYRQHKTEVYYKGDMGPGAPYTVCSDDDESMLCSDQNEWSLSSHDHFWYFDVSIMDYGKNGCKA